MNTADVDNNLKNQFIEYLNSTDDKRKEDFKKAKQVLGNKTVRKPRDMWGAVQERVGLGKGAQFVECTGHGGAIIPLSLNSTIDPELADGYGFYEEDCDIMILLAYYPEMGKKLNPNYERFSTAESTRDYAADKIIYWLSEAKVRAIMERYREDVLAGFSA